MRAPKRRSAGAIVLSLCLFAAACGEDEKKPGPGAAGQGGSAAGDAGTANGGDDSSSGGSGRAGSSSGGSAGSSGGSAGTAGTGGVPVPVFCGNGVVDGDEECERRVGCDETQRCSATCTCEPGPPYTPSSQELIQRAYDAGEIDYATSLMYRVWALFQAPELPEAYDGSGSIGEDTALFIELSRVRGTLPANVETAIAPYLVRPNDPASIFSQPPVLPNRQDPLLPAPPPPMPALVGCAFNDVGLPDWRAHETTNFVVWSCGGGVGGTDPLANHRVVMGTLAEQVLAAMQPKLGPILPDDYAAGPGDITRTDIYIVTLNQCRLRGGACVDIQNPTMASAVPTKPCTGGGAGGGTVKSSAYFVVGANYVPATAPGASASGLRYILAHEIFHGISFGLNLGAQGGTCRENADPGLPEDEGARSWLTEASAEWASFAFFPDDDPARRTELFRLYQTERDLTTFGLHAPYHSLPYQAFLYPLFVQETLDGPDKMFEFWTGAGSARTRDQLDQRLNATLSFAKNFRDFSVRNLNVDLPGDPIPLPHAGWDEALAFDFPRAYTPEPSPELPAPTEFSVPLRIAPLSTDYLHYYISDDARSFRFDASALGNVHLDAIVKVGETWHRERVDGPILEVCRALPNKDISELYLAVSNFDFHRAGRADGDMKVTTRLACPGGWTGYIRVTQTFEENYQRTPSQFETEVENGRFVDTHEWVFAGSMPTDDAGQEVDRARVLFHGNTSGMSVNVTTNMECTDTYTVEDHGGGGYATFWNFQPQGAGIWVWSPGEIRDGYTVNTLTTIGPCDVPTMTYPSMRMQGELWSYASLAPGLGQLVENPDDPGHFRGSANPIHSETPEDAPETILDITVDWDLRRTPAP